LGLLFDPSYLAANFREVGLATVVISLGKGLISGGVVRLFGYRNVIPLAVGLGLFNIGEFAFVLARIGISTGSIGSDLYSLVITSAILSMALTPLLSSQTARIYRWKRRRFKGERIETSNVPRRGLGRHIVIAGGGRVGFQIGKILQRLQIPFVVIELDHRKFEECKAAGMGTVFGDAGSEPVLAAAAIKSADLFIITIPDIVGVRSAVRQSKQLKADIAIVARAAHQSYMAELKECGAADLVLPEFEASLELTRQSLSRLNVGEDEIHRCLTQIRKELYESKD